MDTQYLSQVLYTYQYNKANLIYIYIVGALLSVWYAALPVGSTAGVLGAGLSGLRQLRGKYCSYLTLL